MNTLPTVQCWHIVIPKPRFPELTRRDLWWAGMLAMSWGFSLGCWVLRF